jgi:hypothetical protein
VAADRLTINDSGANDLSGEGLTDDGDTRGGDRTFAAGRWAG